ncbi:hypothetical protein GCM10009819_07500 [Agromyces tropicus]|uniref:SnoaL-like domain-containing protein n=1 Tax=Agromyces tropicus TaxID=555371 RepID=A0ABN2U1P6_9MICO
MTASLTPGWAHSGGFLSLGDGANAGVDAGGADRLEILNVLSRYAWSYDERQLDSLGSVFTEDAVWLGSVKGDFEIEPIRTRDGIVDWLRGHMDSQADQRRHNIINAVVTEQADRSARVLSYLLLTSATDEGVRVVTTGVYDTELIKDDSGAWRISRFFGGFDFPF